MDGNLRLGRQVVGPPVESKFGPRSGVGFVLLLKENGAK